MSTSDVEISEPEEIDLTRGEGYDSDTTVADDEDREVMGRFRVGAKRYTMFLSAAPKAEKKQRRTSPRLTDEKKAVFAARLATMRDILALGGPLPRHRQPPQRRYVGFNEMTFVAEHPVCGLGCFALNPLKARDYATSFVGVTVHRPDDNAPWPDDLLAHEPARYAMRIAGTESVIVPTRDERVLSMKYSPSQQGWACNHSSNPNAGAFVDPTVSYMYIAALRDIDAGEEIVIDYQWTKKQLAGFEPLSHHDASSIYYADLPPPAR